VTAVGRDCLSADTGAKAGFLLDETGPDWLEERGVAARFVAANETVENGCWARSLGRDRAWV
jgi:thiamine biosynthesis lipoprotein ApbE